jgi:hypothetical protein
VKAVLQPQLRGPNPPPLPAQSLAQIHFRGGEDEWLKLNSDLPRLIQCQTVDDLEQGFTQRLYRLMDFLFVLVHEQRDWRIIAVYLHFCDENGQFLPERTVTQSGRIKRQGRGLWAGLRGSKDSNKKEDTNLVGHFLTRESRRESADETIATYLGMTEEEKERELRRILISMDLILEVAEKNRCWRAAAAYLKMVDYDGSFLPMTSAARDRWEKTYARQVDKWEQLEKRRAEKARAENAKGTRPAPQATQPEKVEKAPEPKPVIPVIPVLRVKPATQQEVPVPVSEPEIVDNQRATAGGAVVPKEPDGLVRCEMPLPSVDQIRAALQHPIQSIPVVEAVESPEEADRRERQALQDRLNVAISGRRFRKARLQKKGSTTAQGQLVVPKGKGKIKAQTVINGRMPKLNPERLYRFFEKPKSPKIIGNQSDKYKTNGRSGTDPP